MDSLLGDGSLALCGDIDIDAGFEGLVGAPGPAPVPWAPPQGVPERPARSREVLGALGRPREVRSSRGRSREISGGPDLTGIIVQELAAKVPRVVPGGGAPGGGGLPANSFPVFLQGLIFGKLAGNFPGWWAPGGPRVVR